MHTALYLSLHLRLCCPPTNNIVLPLLLVWLFEKCPQSPLHSQHDARCPDIPNPTVCQDAIQPCTSFDMADAQFNSCSTPYGSSCSPSSEDDLDTPYLLRPSFRESSALVGWTFVDVTRGQASSPGDHDGTYVSNIEESVQYGDLSPQTPHSPVLWSESGGDFA